MGRYSVMSSWMLTVASVVASVGVVSGCNDEPDNKLASSDSDKQLERRVAELEKEQAAQSATNDHQDSGARLTQQTVGEVNTYLAKLHANINGARPQDLPEWQEMYDALTSPAAMDSADFGLGPRQLKTNFYHLAEQNAANVAALKNLTGQLAANGTGDQQQNKALDLILERLATIDNNIRDLNKTMSEKFTAVDKTLADYNGRIEGVENRMKTVEIDLDAFRTEFVSYRQRVTNIETLLRRYDLATMHGDIKNLKDITANHDARLIDLTGKVQVNTSEIAVNRNNLIEAEQELSAVAADVGTLKVAVDELSQRVTSCGCQKYGDRL